MQKTIISCKSRATTKEKMKAFLATTSFVSDSFLIKIKNGKQSCSKLDSEILSFSCDKVNESLYEKRNRSALSFKLGQDSLKKRAYENGIRKEYILENIREFVKLAKIFIMMQRIKYNTYIKNNDYSAFLILELNEKNILTVEEFAGRQLENVITEEVLHELKYS